jgi:hypothetical protein
MDRTADKLTPLWMPWREALKRAGSFDALRPHLGEGRILARHQRLYRPDGKVHSEAGDIKPERWADAREDPATGRLIFTDRFQLTIDLTSGGGEVLWFDKSQELFAVDVELEAEAVDRLFPAAATSTMGDKASLPPAERKLMEPKAWLASARKEHPQRQNERTSDYRDRLHDLMTKADVTKVWSPETLRRRLYDKD